MHLPINVISPNNIRKWQMGFNSALKGLILLREVFLVRRFCTFLCIFSYFIGSAAYYFCFGGWVVQIYILFSALKIHL
jgi:hypothetical protein